MIKVLSLLLILNSNIVQGQTNKLEFITFFKKIDSTISFVATKDKKTIEELILNIPNDREKAIYFQQINNKGYIGIAANIFIYSKAKNYELNQSKYLFLYSLKSKEFVIFQNGLSNRKSFVDSLVERDLFMPDGSVEALVFNSKFEFVKKVFSFDIPKKPVGIKIKEFKTINSKRVSRLRSTKCNLSEKDFNNSMLNSFMENTLCLINPKSLKMLLTNWRFDESFPFPSLIITKAAKNIKSSLVNL